jgi:hypothetical protein
VTDEPFVELEELHAEPSLFPPLILSNEPSPPYVFSHTPPPTPLGRSTATFRWPGSLQHQGPPSLPGLYDLVAWLLPFLDPTSTAKLAVLNTTFSLGPIRPILSTCIDPGLHFDVVAGALVFLLRADHLPVIFPLLRWGYISPGPTFGQLIELTLSWPIPLWSTTWNFVNLQLSSLFLLYNTSVHLLESPPFWIPIKLCFTVQLFSVSIYLWRFRSLAQCDGEYTNRHCKWSSVSNTFTTRRARPAPANLPPVDFARGFRIATEGVPLEGNFVSPIHQIGVHDRYDNHPAITAKQPAVAAKFAAEEEKTFHIHLPRFLIWFINGLFLAPLQWTVRKGKGRICVD